MSKKKVVQITFVQSLGWDIQGMQELIRERAYWKYLERGSKHGSDIDDWLNAESELIWSPSVNLLQQDDSFIANMELWDVQPEEVDAKPGGRFVLVRSRPSHHSDQKGRQVFCGIEFPAEVSRDWTRAEYENGSIRISMFLIEEKLVARQVTA